MNEISKALCEYLGAIYSLSENMYAVRVTDISLYLGISKPSVNRAVGALKTKGFVRHEPYGGIVLTPSGAKIAAEANARLACVKRFLMKTLMLDEKSAESEARRIQHSFSSSRACTARSDVGYCAM